MTDEFSVESVYAELLGRAPENKMEPRLAPLFRAMDVLGEPNKAFPIIHVTGTNGKTSTARMIESVLRAHGLSTGPLHQPAPVQGHRTDQHRRAPGLRRDVRPDLGRDPALPGNRGCRAGGGRPAPPDLLRMPHHPGLRRLRRPARQRGRHRSWPGRHHRRHQRGRRPGLRDHADLAGPHGPAGRHHRGHRA